MVQPTRKHLALLLVAMVGLMLWAGLFPFNYTSHNGASLDGTGRGLVFAGRGIAYSESPLTWPSGPITLEIALTPTPTYSRDIPHLLSLCDGTGREILYLGQWKESLLVRLVDQGRWLDSILREVGVGGVLQPGASVTLSLEVRGRTLTVLADGIVAKGDREFLPEGVALAAAVRSLVLGNSPTGDAPWQGTVQSLGLWTTVQEPSPGGVSRVRVGEAPVPPPEGAIFWYDFSDADGGTITDRMGMGPDLTVPETFTPLRREFLSLPSREFLRRRHFYEDAAVNLLGFVPLAFVLAVFLGKGQGQVNQWKSVVFPVMIGGLLSLIIEANQAFLASRTSSLTDLALNTLGSGLGAGGYLLLTRRQADRAKR